MAKKESGKFFVNAILAILGLVISFTNVYALSSGKQNDIDNRKGLEAKAMDKIRLNWAYKLNVKKPSHKEFDMQNKPELSVIQKDDKTELATLAVPNSYEGTFSMSCRFRIIDTEQSNGIAIGVKSSGDRMCLFEILFKLTKDNHLVPFLHAVSNEGNVVTKDSNATLKAGNIYTLRLDYTDNAVRCLIFGEKGKIIWDTRRPDGDILFDGRWFDIDCICFKVSRSSSIASAGQIEYNPKHKAIVLGNKAIEIYHLSWDVPGAGIGPNNIRQMLVKEAEIPSPMSLRPDLRISCREWNLSMITIAPWIPVIEKECTVNIKIANDGKSQAKNIPVKLIISSPDISAAPIQKIKLIEKLDAGKTTLLKFKFTPKQTGTYQAAVIVDPAGEILETDENNNSCTLSFPVVRDSYTIYYHHCQRLPLTRIRYKTLVNVYYGNVGSSVSMKKYGLPIEEKEGEYWKRYGLNTIRVCSIPYKTAEKRVKYWAGRGPGPILIEEIGSNWKGQKARLMRDAIVLFRKKFPKRFFSVYTGPRIPPIIAPVLKKMNLIVPECYYLHERQYEYKDFGKEYFTKIGLANKTMILLGIDSRRGPDPKTGGNRITPRWSPGYRAIERQIRYLRTVWPENKFCGFYITFADSKLTSEAERLAYRYYIMPVLKSIRSNKNNAIEICNIGGMDAHNVKLKLSSGKDESIITIPEIQAGDKIDVKSDFDNFSIISQDNLYTVLD